MSEKKKPVYDEEAMSKLSLQEQDEIIKRGDAAPIYYFATNNKDGDKKDAKDIRFSMHKMKASEAKALQEMIVAIEANEQKNKANEQKSEDDLSL